MPTISSGHSIEALRSLAGVLNDVRRSSPGVAVEAIQVLNVKHPLPALQVDLVRAEGARNQDGSWPAYLRAALPALSVTVGYTIYQTVASIGQRWLLRRTLRAISRRPISLVAKTWSVTRRRPERDFYLGDLQPRLQSHGVRALMLYGNASRAHWWAFARGHAGDGELPALPEQCLVPAHAPLVMLVRQMIASMRLWRHGARSTTTAERAASLVASVEALRFTTMRNGLYSWIMREAVRRFQPRAVLTLYEGNAWERCAWQGAHEASHRCTTMGYQHTVLFPDMVALLDPEKRSPQTSPAPDVVLCLGGHTLAGLSGLSRHGSRLIRFGSFRARGPLGPGPAPALRRTVLVVPEGIADEVAALFNFVKDCAPRLPDWTFLLRAHPVLPLDAALRIVGRDLLSHPNVITSRSPAIEGDLHRSCVLLHRGSSVAFHAVWEGLFPVYVERMDPLLDLNPLEGMPAWGGSCRTSEEFAAILRDYALAPRQDSERAWRRAAAYIDEYMPPVSDAAVKELAHAVMAVKTE